MKGLRILVLFGAIACMGLAVSCDDGGGSDSGDDLTPPAYDLGGQWNFEKTAYGNCSGVDYPEIDSGIFSITQSGNSITAEFPEDVVYYGTLSGTTITLSQKLSDGSGTLSLKVSGSVSNEGAEINAAGNWSWRSSDTSYSCSGTVQIEASRNSSGAYYRDISIGAVYSESIGPNGTKAYRFQTAQAGSYTISLADCASDLGWSLYSFDPGDVSPDDLDDNVIDLIHGDQYWSPTNENEVYALHLSASTYYILVVDEYDGDGSSSYNLSVVYDDDVLPGDVVVFSDANLESAVRDALGIPSGYIHQDDMATLYWLDGDYSDIESLEGLQYAVNLNDLFLYGNAIVDLSPIETLSALEFLDLSDNSITDITPLEGLVNLSSLYLSDNQIIDISMLQGLINLEYLVLSSNQIIDINALQGLSNLNTLLLNHNQITDISPLQGLVNLSSLHLIDNQIIDIGPLVANGGLDDGDFLILWNNPLNADACSEDIPALEARGVDVWYYGCD